MHITINNAALDKDGAEILKRINLHAGEKRIGIIGRNGAGKTSLMHLITGLSAPTRGTVRINDIDPAQDRRAALQLVGILFQNPDHQIIFPTVEEELSFGLRQQGLNAREIKQKIEQILDQFSILHWRGRPISELSHGQKQLLCLLSILAMAPKLIVLDEPFSGLDLAMRIRLSAIFEELEQTIIHVSHDPSALENYDRIIWVDQGEIINDGPANVILPKYINAMQERAIDAFADKPG